MNYIHYFMEEDELEEDELAVRRIFAVVENEFFTEK